MVKFRILFLNIICSNKTTSDAKRHGSLLPQNLTWHSLSVPKTNYPNQNVIFWERSKFYSKILFSLSNSHTVESGYWMWAYIREKWLNQLSYGIYDEINNLFGNTNITTTTKSSTKYNIFFFYRYAWCIGTIILMIRCSIVHGSMHHDSCTTIQVCDFDPLMHY